MKSLAVLIVQICAFVLLHTLPVSLLKRWLERLLSRGRYRFVPTFSGRVALFIVASHLRNIAKSSVSLLPDYTCNIVERAFTMAGWEIVKYRTNEILEPDWYELLDTIKKREVGVVVGASVFGSSALLNFLSESSKQDELRKQGVHVVVDLAQDIRLIDRLPLNCADFVHAVVSFNDKSFLGAMGGGILSEWDQFHSLSPGLSHETKQLYFWFVAKLLHHLYRVLSVKLRSLGKASRAEKYITISSYDYSYCKDYPYRIEVLKPVKLQFVLAIIGLYSLSYLQSKKKKFLSRNLHIPTQFAESAAYLMIDITKTPAQGTVRCRMLKLPYAVEGNPKSSLRPYDIIVHNKGFADEG